jgi:hypothetical protein
MTDKLKTNEKLTLIHLHGLLAGLHRAPISLRPADYNSQLAVRQNFHYAKWHGLQTPSADRNQQRSIQRLSEQGLAVMAGSTRGLLVKLSTAGLLTAETLLDCPPARMHACMSMLLKNAKSGQFKFTRVLKPTALYSFMKWDWAFTSLEMLGAIRCAFNEFEGLYSIEIMDSEPSFLDATCNASLDADEVEEAHATHESAITTAERISEKQAPKESRNELGLRVGVVTFRTPKAERDCQNGRGVFSINF